MMTTRHIVEYVPDLSEYIKEADMYNLLFDAVDSGDAGSIRDILHGDDKIPDHVLVNGIIRAIDVGRVDMAEYMLSNSHTGISAHMLDKFLMYAVASNNLDMVELFLGRGARHLSIPIMIAVRNGYFDVVKTLVDHGADVNKSVVKSAYINGHDDMANYLGGLLRESEEFLSDAKEYVTDMTGDEDTGFELLGIDDLPADWIEQYRYVNDKVSPLHPPVIVVIPKESWWKGDQPTESFGPNPTTGISIRSDYIQSGDPAAWFSHELAHCSIKDIPESERMARAFPDLERGYPNNREEKLAFSVQIKYLRHVRKMDDGEIISVLKKAYGSGYDENKELFIKKIMGCENE